MPGLAAALVVLLRLRARACALLACVWATLLVANLASAEVGVQAETRVWDFEEASTLNVCSNPSASPRLHRENQLARSELALGSPHAARAAPQAIGFARGTAETAFEGMRSGGGHAMRKLISEGLIPNSGSLSSRVQTMKNLLTPVLESPARSFNWRVGATQAKGFIGNVGHFSFPVDGAKSRPDTEDQPLFIQ